MPCQTCDPLIFLSPRKNHCISILMSVWLAVWLYICNQTGHLRLTYVFLDLFQVVDGICTLSKVETPPNHQNISYFHLGVPQLEKHLQTGCRSSDEAGVLLALRRCRDGDKKERCQVLAILTQIVLQRTSTSKVHPYFIHMSCKIQIRSVGYSTLFDPTGQPFDLSIYCNTYGYGSKPCAPSVGRQNNW